MLGRALVSAVSAGLILLGLVLADACPPLSGGNFLGAALVALGGLLFTRMIYVASRC